MSNYHRVRLAGGMYFFTVVTFQRIPIFTNEDRVEMLRQAFRKIKAIRPFEIDAMVILPDHLHCIWRMPEEDADYSARWREIKNWHRVKSVSSPMPETSVWSGSADFGNMPFAMMKIGANIWITFITTR